MFATLIRRVQTAAQNMAGDFAIRAAVVLPFVIAAGFLVAAVSIRLNREYGAEAGNLIIAGFFAFVGVVAALVINNREADETAEEEQEAVREKYAEAKPASAQDSAVDRELLKAALASAAPVLIPEVGKILVRNLPLVAAVAAGLFVLTRQPEQPGGDNGSLRNGHIGPAE